MSPGFMAFTAAAARSPMQSSANATGRLRTAAIAVSLGLIGAVTIVVMAVKIEPINLAPILVYVIGLVTMLVFSAAYNMWPVSPVKWVLRRFDHSAVYLLIAGTYTPFLAQMKNALASASLGVGV
jgi:hemolysin III